MYTITLTLKQFIHLADFAGVIIDDDLAPGLDKRKIEINDDGYVWGSDGTNGCPRGEAVLVMSVKSIISVAEDFFMRVFHGLEDQEARSMHFTLHENYIINGEAMGLSVYCTEYPDEGFVPLSISH